MPDLPYRDRLYGSYVQGRTTALAPQDIKGLAPRAPAMRRLIRAHFPEDRDSTILDLGCGYGGLLHFARENGYHNVRGVDASVEQVEAARNLGIEGVELGDVMDHLASVPTESIDVVSALDVLEHFRKDETLALADEVCRVLRLNGRWINHVPNAESPFGARIRYSDLTHELAFTPESIGQLVRAAGFRTVRCYEDTPIPHGLKSGLRWLLWKAIRFGLKVYLAAETGATDYVLSQNVLAVALK